MPPAQKPQLPRAARRPTSPRALRKTSTVPDMMEKEWATRIHLAQQAAVKAVERALTLREAVSTASTDVEVAAANASDAMNAAKVAQVTAREAVEAELKARAVAADADALAEIAEREATITASRVGNETAIAKRLSEDALAQIDVERCQSTWDVNVAIHCVRPTGKSTAAALTPTLTLAPHLHPNLHPRLSFSSSLTRLAHPRPHPRPRPHPHPHPHPNPLPLTLT